MAKGVQWVDNLINYYVQFGLNMTYKVYYIKQDDFYWLCNWSIYHKCDFACFTYMIATQPMFIDPSDKQCPQASSMHTQIQLVLEDSQ